jgi:hypothetical protein
MNVDASLRAHLPATIKASHAEAGRPAAMGNAHLESGAGVENPPEDEYSHD